MTRFNKLNFYAFLSKTRKTLVFLTKVSPEKHNKKDVMDDTA
jgi:hypothetical protein